MLQKRNLWFVIGRKIHSVKNYWNKKWKVKIFYGPACSCDT